MSLVEYDLGNGRKVYRMSKKQVAPARSDLASPMLVRAFSSPVQSMATGEWYDTPRDLERSYKASGNPQGIDYVCVGNEDTTRFTPPKRDRKADREAIERAICDVESGNAPPILTEPPV